MYILTGRAHLAIARYDSDLAGQLAGIEETLVMFPGEPNLLLRQIDLLWELDREYEYRQILKANWFADPPIDRDTIPIVQQKLAKLLPNRGGEHGIALSLLR